jgi:uncharacterized repeat protein (TIGR03803 family)
MRILYNPDKGLLALCSLLITIIATSVSYGQSKLWGNTDKGGSHNIGVIFSTNEDGTGLTVHKEFTYPAGVAAVAPGSQPMLAADGYFYGMTQQGGTHDAGIMYRFDPSTSILTPLHDFGSVPNDGGFAVGTFLQASNGRLYGLTQGGGNSTQAGILFEYDPSSGNYTILHTFGLGVDGVNPTADVIEAANGKFYGTTLAGGEAGAGTIFEYDPATSTYASKYSFDYDSGGSPSGNLFLASNGKVYGMTQFGNNNEGMIFEYVAGASSITVVAEFDDSNGGFPTGSLTETNGKLYGITGGGGSNGMGVIFEFDPSTNVITNKFDLDGTTTGAYSQGSLALCSSGKFYGLFSFGGANNVGTLFEYDPSTNAFSTKLDLDRSSGLPGYGTPFFTADGKMHGTMITGGTNNTGVLFEYDPGTNSYVNKLSFAGAPDGRNPNNKLTLAANGKFYSITLQGGTGDYGTVYEFDPVTLVFSKKADFTKSNGAYPVGALANASNGKLYGTTQRGGANDQGVIFEYDPATASISNQFDLDFNTGTFLFNGLIATPNGKLYGASRDGGTNSRGALLEFDPLTNSVTIIYSFAQATGATPTAALTLGSDNNLYGVANGGAQSAGVVFKYDLATSTYTKTAEFNSIGAVFPRSSLTNATNGKMYGLTLFGNTGAGGVLYEYDPVTAALIDRYDFPSSGTTGFSPRGTMTLSSNGKLYGMTQGGGANNLGTFFEYDPATSAFNQLFELNGSNGANPSYTGLTLLTQTKTSQTITFNPLKPKKYGHAPFKLHATASSNLPVSYTSSDPAVATVSGKIVTITGVGETIITASQPGDATYAPATPVTQTLTIKKGKNIITFDPIPNKSVSDPPFVLAATSSSGLPVTYTSPSNKISISGSTVTIIKAGNVTITAHQDGDDLYNAATKVQQSFTISPAIPTITPLNHTMSTVLASSADAGNQWFLNGNPIEGATGKTLTVNQSGSYTVRTSQDNSTSEFSVAHDVAVKNPGVAKDLVTIYPNPAAEFIVVSIPGPGNKSAIVYHEDGRQLDTKGTAGNEITFDIKGYAAGMYVVKVSAGDSQQVARFIKN